MLTSLVAALTALFACELSRDEPPVQLPVPTISNEYVAAFRKLCPAAPDGADAFRAYLQAYRSYGEGPEPDIAEAVFDPSFSPAHPHWNDARAFLEREKTTLELFRRAAAMPVMAPPLFDTDELLRVFPSEFDTEPAAEDTALWFVAHRPLALLVRAESLLRLDARVAALESDGARLVADIEALCGLSRHAREVPLEWHMLHANRFAGVAMQTACWSLAAPPGLLGENHLLAVQTALQTLDATFRSDGLRLVMEDSLQRLYSDDGAGDGRISPEGIRKFRSRSKYGSPFITEVPGYAEKDMLTLMGKAALDPGRRKTREMWLSLIELGETGARSTDPDRNWHARPALGKLDQYCTSTKSLVLQHVYPMPDALVSSQFITHSSRDAAMAAIALHRFRLAKGTWPEALEQLVPDYLDAVPLDMFTGEPLKYRSPTAETPVPLLYSVGSDKDDDGGAGPVMETQSNGYTPSFKPEGKYDGDWVFLQAPASTAPKPAGE